MTPILLPFPEDSDAHRLPPNLRLEEVKFWWFTGAKLVRDSGLRDEERSSPDHIRSESTANRMYEALG